MTTNNILLTPYESDVYSDLYNSDSNSIARATSDTLGYTQNGTSLVTGNNVSDTNMFLKLLVAQMSNLDPLSDNSDPTQYITQLAQFTTLEEMQKMNTNLNTLSLIGSGLLVNSALSTSSNFIGKEVEFLKSLSGTETVSGKVESVYIENGVVYMDAVLESGEKQSFAYENFVKLKA